MGKDVDAVTGRPHERGPNDAVDVALPGRAFPKGMHDGIVVDHNDDPMTRQKVRP